MLNKRGQGLSINAIILIILGILVLIFIVIGFTVGWNKILPILGGGANVADIQNQCSFACSSASTFDFCDSKRNVKVGADNELVGFGSSFDATCNELAELVQELGIQGCPAVDCGSITPYSNKGFAEGVCTKQGGAIGGDSDALIIYGSGFNAVRCRGLECSAYGGAIKGEGIESGDPATVPANKCHTSQDRNFAIGIEDYKAGSTNPDRVCCVANPDFVG